MHNYVTTNICTNFFSMPGNKMVPVHVHVKKTRVNDCDYKDTAFQT